MERAHLDPSLPPADSLTPMLLRMPTVVRITGLARSTIYKMITDKTFPSPVRLGPRMVAWRRSDLDLWSDERPPARP